MIINYEYYQIFFYVAEKLNFTEAANELFLSQSTVSRVIQNLEHDLGCTLLIRSKQKLALTKSGEFLYEHLKKSFAFITMAENHLCNEKELKSGILKIGATELTFQHFLLPYITSFERLYPNIHIIYNFVYPETAIQDLNNGLLDIALLSIPIKTIVNTINYQKMCEYEQVIIAGDKYKKYSKTPILFKELENESFILTKKGTAARTYVEQLFEENQMSCSPKHEACSTPLIISMVEANLGLGIVPRIFVKEKIAQGTLLEIKTNPIIKSLPIYALTSNLFQVSAIRDKFLLQLKTTPSNFKSML